MKTKFLSLEQGGFTLIETLMAMAIFTIGILGLFGMQTAAIKENLAANNITTGTTWASDQVEKLTGLHYNDTKLLDDEGQFDNLDKDNNSGNGLVCFDDEKPPICDDKAPPPHDDCNGLNDRVYNPGNLSSSDGFISEDAKKLAPPIYKIYWNVAEGCILSNAKNSDDKAGLKAKNLRIIVTRDNGNGSEEEVAIVNHITRYVR